MPPSSAIGDHFEQFIRQQIKSGRYASDVASEVSCVSLKDASGCGKLRSKKYRTKISESIARTAL